MKSFRRLLTIAVCLMLIAAMAAGCKKKQPETSATTTEAETVTETTASALEFVGYLIDAQVYEMTLINEQCEMVFDISKAQFKGASDGLAFGDKMTITYEVVGSKNVASKVEITEEAKEEKFFFEGIVSDLHDYTIDVTCEGATVRFSYNSGTKIIGNLSKGDKVSVEYQFNLSQYPFADVITVTSENKNPEKDVCVGWISSYNGGQIYVSIESNHGFYFKITDKTKITGVSNTIKAGQKVCVVYSGDTDETPEAIQVEILQDAKQEIYVISGKVGTVKDESISVKTDKNEITFKTTTKTNYYGEAPKSGLDCTVKYTGYIETGATAIEVECRAEEPTETSEEPTETSEEPTETSEEPTETSEDPTETSEEPTETSEDPTEPTSETPSPIPSVGGTAIIVSWENNEAVLKNANNKELKLKLSDNLKMPVGYMPQESDVIKIKYDMTDMILVEAELLARPDKMAQGVVVSYDKDNNKCVLTKIETPRTLLKENGDPETKVAAGQDKDDELNAIKGQDNVEFTLGGNIDIPEDYNPQAGDVIKFKYSVTVENSTNENVYLITFIRFVSQPE